MENDINLTVVQTNNGPVLALMQNHVVLYIPANDNGLKLADGIAGIITDINESNKQSSIVKPPVDFNARKQ